MTPQERGNGRNPAHAPPVLAGDEFSVGDFQRVVAFLRSLQRVVIRRPDLAAELRKELRREGWE